MEMHFKKHSDSLINMLDNIWAPHPLSLFYYCSALYSFLKEVNLQELQLIFQFKIRNLLFMK